MNWAESKWFEVDTGSTRKIITNYIDDMSDGVNISGTNKGARSYARLNAIRVRIPQIARFIYEKYKKEITDVSEDEIVKLFRDMERGIIKKIPFGFLSKT